MELNGSITVTCIFATGASSTGCQVTIFTVGGLREVFSENITRSDRANQVNVAHAGANRAAKNIYFVCCILIDLIQLQASFFNLTLATPSLAGQPLLTQKTRKGLVNGVTSVCLQVEYMNYQ